MKIDVKLSETGINNLISRLQTIKENLQYGIEQTVEILAKEGADEANRAYGGIAYASESKEDSNTAVITVTGKNPIIAEFGAGYATMEYHPFAKNAPVPIEVASYSKMNFDQSPYGGLFWITNDLYPNEGYWYFGGETYDRVEARHGLLNANDYIVAKSTEIAKEVIKL